MRKTLITWPAESPQQQKRGERLWPAGKYVRIQHGWDREQAWRETVKLQVKTKTSSKKRISIGEVNHSVCVHHSIKHLSCTWSHWNANESVTTDDIISWCILYFLLHRHGKCSSLIFNVTFENNQLSGRLWRNYLWRRHVHQFDAFQ